MKMLYCCWYENSEGDTIKNLEQMGIEVSVLRKSVKEYLNNEADDELEDYLEKDIDIVFSYNFFPQISKICNKHEKRYISWIYDWPNYTVFNPEIYNKCNEVYLFERDGIAMLEKYQVMGLNYMPLAVDVKRLDEMLDNDIEKSSYQYDVSFVGNLYLNKEEAMFSEHVPEYYSGMVEALCAAQQKIYGYNLANDIITEEFTKKYFETINGKLSGIYAPDSYVLASQINKYITGCERKKLLTHLSEKLPYDVHLFAHNKPIDMENVILHEGVDYFTQMPQIFRSSKINLNITLRSITSGIPLRVFDILGAGGFCLTNYQTGIMEHFVDGRDLVMYTGAEDLLQKIEYYMTHEEERIQIAKNGHEAVKKYQYQQAFVKMLQC